MKKCNLFSLRNRVAVVTGGYGYLGSSMCDCLAEFGSHVVVAGRDIKKCEDKAAQLKKRYKVNALGIEMDISSAAGVEAAMAKIAAEADRIDILINNAFFGHKGGFEGDMKYISDDMWACGMEGTATVVFRCIKGAIPYMEKRGGSIINISSMYGIVSPNPRVYGKSGFNNPPAYGAGKAAVLQFTRYTACHLATKGIRVNSVSPGAFPNKAVQKDSRLISNLKRMIPMGRIGEPEDLKGVIVFLASDASRYVTGANISVDGGWTAW